MKNILSLILLSFVVLSCDKIDNPYDDTTSLTSNKKVLLEDFTGHTCSNCPEATRTADALKEIYKENLIIVATHCTFFANPKPPSPSGAYNVDYRTNTGSALDDYFLIEEAGLPKGMVNRTPYDGNLLLSQTAWGSAVAKAFENPAKVEIELSATYTSSNKMINVDVDISYLDFSNNDHQLVVYVLEDSIVSWQKDGAVHVENYVHKDLLRANITENVFGQKVAPNVLGPGDSIRKNYSMTAKEEWNINQVKIVAFVHDNKTKEVLQAEEIHLIH